MIYLDNGATSLHKPKQVIRAIERALATCANPGRGGYEAAMRAAETVYNCRAQAGKLFDCPLEQVVFTSSCTHGLNIAIRSLVKPGSRVVISGFEHNAVLRPLHAVGANVIIAGTKLFDWTDTISSFRKALEDGVDAAVITHCSNVFGYILPIDALASLCRMYDVPLIVDAAQSAGVMPVSLKKWDAAFVAMPGHKGLLGPQGTGILLCGGNAQPLIYGGTGSLSAEITMPDFLPDALEAGTLNVPGIAGLKAGLDVLEEVGISAIAKRENEQALYCCNMLNDMRIKVFQGPHQSGTVSFLTVMDCEEMANALGREGICVRAGLHCAPLAHRSAGTFESGTVRISFGLDASTVQVEQLQKALLRIQKKI